MINSRKVFKNCGLLLNNIKLNNTINIIQINNNIFDLISYHIFMLITCFTVKSITAKEMFNSGHKFYNKKTLICIYITIGLDLIVSFVSARTHRIKKLILEVII